MRAVLLIAVVVITFCRGNKTRSTYFIHNINAERWNKYVCESCKYNYHPVCGSDLKTYTNPCRLTCAAEKMPGLHLLHRGECLTRKHEERSLYAEGCPECRIVPMSLLCAQNEVTFYNLCYFECFRQKYGLRKIAIVHTGACFVDDEKHMLKQGETMSCICNRETVRGIFLRHDVGFRVKKICGAITMYNKCQYDCEAKNGGFIEYPGICGDIEMYKHPSLERTSLDYNPCQCVNRTNPVCAVAHGRESLALLRKNSCHAACERERQTTMKDCLPRKCGCSAEYQPTCALKQFRDVCHFECYRKIVNPGLTLHGAVKCPVPRNSF